MNYHFKKLAKHTPIALCFVAVCGGLVSCSDSYDLDDEGNNPPGYGNTIYGALKNPEAQGLTGTFKTYLRIIEDLGYATTMDGQASSTVFAANDEAFERFFKNNVWGVTKYEDLSTTMKRQLLYSSMLDNPMLVEMLSNIPNDNTSVTRGIAIKHATKANATDTITHIYAGSGLLPNTTSWEYYWKNGIDMVMDATDQMIVHFTPEQMTTNLITMKGNPSDFEVITGEPYNEQEQPAYVFRDKIIHKDVSCKNGYIQQMQDVLLNPGNMAQMLRNNSDTKLFSTMLDRFSAPYYNAYLTINYNNNARQLGIAGKDSIFEMRYFSNNSQGSQLKVGPHNENIGLEDNELLPYDPGWNAYRTGLIGENEFADVAAMFVPTDQALINYFTTTQGGGKFIIDQFAGAENNTPENLKENLYKIPLNIMAAFVSNLMKVSFNSSVPSKFDFVLDDAGDPMKLNLDYLHKTADGKYDVRIANNGVMYMLDHVMAPAKYRAVSAPALFNQDMKVMNWLIQDKSVLGLNFYAYLLAMDANYALLIPDDDAFANYYIDPVTYNSDKPVALKFFYKNSQLLCSKWDYDKTTGEVGDSIGYATAASYKSQLTDILNYHTLVLDSTEVFGSNRYYKTKHGGEVFVDMNEKTIASGATTNSVFPKAKLTLEQARKQPTSSDPGNNGVTYRLNHVITPPMNSVYSTLKANGFNKFLEYCEASGDNVALGVMDALELTEKEQSRYFTFVNKGGFDYNVSYFNTYNYTVYAPSDAAMEKAFANGLPTWQDVAKTIDGAKNLDVSSQEYKDSMQHAADMVGVIDNFIRYHFQDNSVYADKHVKKDNFESAASDSLGRHIKLSILPNGTDKFYVVDHFGNKIEINANSSKMVNVMARDYEFKGTDISTSSFAVVHEIDEPLNFGSSKLYYDWKHKAKAANSVISKKYRARHRR